MKKTISAVIILSALTTSCAFAEGVKKSIKILANINDAIYVSKPDGSSWYDTAELMAKDYQQKQFASDDLQVRVWSTKEDFEVSLMQPLVISRNDGVQLSDVKVNFGGKDVSESQKAAIKQTVSSGAGFENTYNLKITAAAPTTTVGSASTNGSYQGDLVMLFEPKI